MSDLLSTITGAGKNIFAASGTRLIFRSNISPDIRIDLSKLMEEQAKPSPAPAPTTPAVAEPETADVEVAKDIMQSDSPNAMAFIRPQVAITTGIGLGKVFAPYGPPIKNAWLLALVVLAASGLVGARIAWAVCKRVPPKKKAKSSTSA